MFYPSQQSVKGLTEDVLPSLNPTLGVRHPLLIAVGTHTCTHTNTGKIIIIKLQKPKSIHSRIPQRTESYSAIENNKLLIYTIQKNLGGFMEKKTIKIHAVWLHIYAEIEAD